MNPILFIKTSSLGDVIHNMPAVTEARRYRPKARIAWMVEEPFAPLVALHPAVDRVIPVAVRRWRRHLARMDTWREGAAFAAMLREGSYDAVIDTQGLLRTGFMSRLARGRRHGYDAASAREWAASLFYDVRHPVSRRLHAISRNRILTGRALDYTPEGPPTFGLEGLRPNGPESVPTAVLMHATARVDKQWPEQCWRDLATALVERGFAPILPSGTAAERERSNRIATGLPSARLLDREPLDTVVRTVAAAHVAIGVDTGLLHLGAALGVPTVAIFVGASDPRLTGPIGVGPIELLGADGIAPTAAAVVAAADRIGFPAPIRPAAAASQQPP